MGVGAAEVDREEDPAQEGQFVAPTLGADRPVLHRRPRDGVVELEDHAVEARVPARPHVDEPVQPAVERKLGRDPDRAGGKGGPSGGGLGNGDQPGEQAEGDSRDTGTHGAPPP